MRLRRIQADESLTVVRASLPAGKAQACAAGRDARTTSEKHQPQTLRRDSRSFQKSGSLGRLRPSRSLTSEDACQCHPGPFGIPETEALPPVYSTLILAGSSADGAR